MEKNIIETKYTGVESYLSYFRHFLNSSKKLFFKTMSSTFRAVAGFRAGAGK